MIDLVDVLRARQVAEGQSDLVFAAQLGVNRETWRLQRTGQTRPGPRTLQGVMRAFPDLAPLALAVLLSLGASTRAADDSKRAEVAG
jgi:hypothetical protein